MRKLLWLTAAAFAVTAVAWLALNRGKVAEINPSRIVVVSAPQSAASSPAASHDARPAASAPSSSGGALPPLPPPATTAREIDELAGVWSGSDGSYVDFQPKGGAGPGIYEVKIRGVGEAEVESLVGEARGHSLAVMRDGVATLYSLRDETVSDDGRHVQCLADPYGYKFCR